jgi:hypothetical protein
VNEIGISISGELYDELRHGTQLDNGQGEIATWGYGASRLVDVEVWRMTQDAYVRKHGFGHVVTMSGSYAAWLAISEYAADRAEIELQGAGDFDRSMGHRLSKQAAKIKTSLASAS